MRRFLASLERLDIPALRELITDDFSWTVPGGLSISGTYEGKSAFENQFLVGAAELFATGTLTFDIKHLFAEGEVVVAEYTGTGKSATTGKPYRNHYCVIFHVRNGKIELGREYMDTAHVAEALLADSPA
ncbi:nuclear transport factor 2 family protein [Mycobacteroides abscessus]|uniref:nuclear transport factor 2 family protein n=1 Tax=Mycobacteroides abscessus TaxID=36809 RepID=UPI0002E2DFBF|nr:nuclear transport factor 2 family protein [Mycobacteroides abscessus]